MKTRIDKAKMSFYLWYTNVYNKKYYQFRFFQLLIRKKRKVHYPN